MSDDATQLLQEGRLDECLASLTSQVKAKPADSKLRVFMFQLLCVRGEWKRAMNQLNVTAELDPGALAMAQVCRPALNCEALREEVFSGKRAPHIFGEPEPWVGKLVQANELTGLGKDAEGAALRAEAFEEAPAVGGEIDGQRIEWVADADSRLGPVLEMIVEGRYFWVPFSRIGELTFEAPADLRDAVWALAQVTWSNGGSGVAIVPVRYPGTASSGDDSLRMARKTEWVERGGDTWVGLGQRVLTTDVDDYPLLAIRSMKLDAPAPEGADG